MIDILERYCADGLLTKQTHPNLDLIIWNYTPDCQINKKWDPITLQCRGLITDFSGKIVARCIPKFFNLEEHTPEDIPNESFEVSEKMDGSYLNIFHYSNEWLVSSRGSFTSTQAIKGTELLKKLNTEKLIPGLSYVGELITKENRIVVDYGDMEKIIFITAYDVENGYEVNVDNMVNQGFDVVKKYHGITDYTILKDMIDDNAEGFVVRFHSGFRIKIKGREYLRLHAILTQISTRDIWEWAKNGKTIEEMLVDVPDEFYDWANKTYNDLTSKFITIKNEVEKEYWSLIDRKDYAEKIKNKKYKHLLFKKLTSHSNQFNDMIWDTIFPDFSRPFNDKSLGNS